MRPFAVHRSKSGTRLEWDTTGVDEMSWVCSLTFSASQNSLIQTGILHHEEEIFFKLGA